MTVMFDDDGFMKEVDSLWSLSQVFRTSRCSVINKSVNDNTTRITRVSAR